MPRYVYTCQKCGAQVEKQRSVAKRDAWTPCPTCFGEMRREIAAPGFVLKGQGWPGKEGKGKV